MPNKFPVYSCTPNENVQQIVFDKVVLLNGTESALDAKNTGVTPMEVGEIAINTTSKEINHLFGTGDLRRIPFPAPTECRNATSVDFQMKRASDAQSASGVYSTISGGGNNTVSGYTSNATIGGGFLNTVSTYGSGVFMGGGYGNTASGQYTLVVGGINNNIGDSSGAIIVGGGTGNVACGTGNCIGTNAFHALIVNGVSNCSASCNGSVINGVCNRVGANSGVGKFSLVDNGCFNRATVNYSTIVNGISGLSSGVNSFIGNGFCNNASNNYSTIVNGFSGFNSAQYAFIGGGICNKITGTGSSNIVGGAYNNINGGGCSSIVGGLSGFIGASLSFVGGGIANTVGNIAPFSFIGGGCCNYGCTSANGILFIGGGGCNRITGNAGCSVIVGGFCNCSTNAFSFIGGGFSNKNTANYSSIMGGISGESSGCMSVINSGRLNTSSGLYSSVINGLCNISSGTHTFIAGGSANNTRGFANTFILGTSLSATQPNYTYVNNLSVQGNIASNTAYTVTAYVSSNQTVDGSNDLQIPLVVKNDPNGWVTGQNTNSAVITPTIPGYYFISYQVAWQTTTGTGQQNIQIRQNGSTTRSLVQMPLYTGTGAHQTMTTTAILYLNGVSDSVNFSAYGGASQQLIGTSDGNWTKAEIFKIN